MKFTDVFSVIYLIIFIFSTCENTRYNCNRSTLTDCLRRSNLDLDRTEHTHIHTHNYEKRRGGRAGGKWPGVKSTSPELMEPQINDAMDHHYFR